MSHNNVHRCKGSENCHDENHLCKIIIRKDLERIRRLVQDAHFYCRNCGRAAHDRENLCKPSHIETG